MPGLIYDQISPSSWRATAKTRMRNNVYYVKLSNQVAVNMEFLLVIIRNDIPFCQIGKQSGNEPEQNHD